LYFANSAKLTLPYLGGRSVGLGQGWANCGTRAILVTPSNFQWHEEAPCFTYRFCYDSQEVSLTLTCREIRM